LEIPLSPYHFDTSLLELPSNAAVRVFLSLLLGGLPEQLSASFLLTFLSEPLLDDGDKAACPRTLDICITILLDSKPKEVNYLVPAKFCADC
jgi:hypothetical protein